MAPRTRRSPCSPHGWCRRAAAAHPGSRGACQRSRRRRCGRRLAARARGTGALGRGAAPRTTGGARIFAAGASSSRWARPGRLRGLVSGQPSSSGAAALRPSARPDDAIVATAVRRRSVGSEPHPFARRRSIPSRSPNRTGAHMRLSPRRPAALWCSRGAAATPKAGCRRPARSCRTARAPRR